MSGVYVWLRRSELVAAGACSDGLADFDRLAASQGRSTKVRLTWDSLGAALAWQSHPEWCAWLAAKSMIPPTSTSGNGGTSTSGNGGTSTSGNGGTSTSGDYGTSTSGNGGTSTSGDGGTSTSGDGGTSTSGYGGTSTSGDYGTSTSGNGGTSTSGDGGTSTSGYGGTSTSGYGGEIRIRWWCGSTQRYRLAVGYVGEDGIEADVAYVVRDDGRLVRRDGR